MTCTICGKENTADAKFCVGCGVLLGSDAAIKKDILTNQYERAVNTSWIKTYENILRIETILWKCVGVFVCTMFMFILLRLIGIIGAESVSPNSSIVITIAAVLWFAWGFSIMRRKIMISIAHNLSITTNNLSSLVSEIIESK